MSEWYRYPGPKPFRKDQAGQYHGRNHDIEQLFNQVMLNSCIVMVGKSGVGKSSLINAGLLPKIEAEINTASTDRRYFRALPLTLQAYNPQGGLSLVDKIHRIVETELGVLEPEADQFLNFLDDTNRRSINFTLKKYQLQGYLNERKEMFLLIFDQLEQLFSYPLNEVEALEAELREIVNPNLPDAIRKQLDVTVKTNGYRLQPSEIAMLENPASVKFLFAIRSDRLSLLIRLRNAIPDILLSPYELKPMNRTQATNAIVSPAAAVDERFFVQPFSYKPSVLETIFKFIEKLPNSDIEFKFYDGKIEPIILQIICRFIEEKVAPNDSDRIISDGEIDLANILENYYEGCIEALQLPGNEQQRVRILLEEKLIYERDKRRLTFYEGVIKKDYKVPKKVLDQLTERGLLRCISTVGFESSYEIAHDWLVTPVLAARQRRTSRGQMEEDPYLNSIEKSISVSKNDSALLLQRANYYATIGRNKDAIFDYTMVNSLLPKISYDVLLSRANAYTADGCYAEAEMDLKQVLENAPELVEAKQRMGINYHEQGRLEEAEEFLTSYLKDVPHDTDTINYLGIIALAQGRVDESVKLFKEVLGVNPNYQIASYNLGVVSYNNKNYEEASRYFNAALELPTWARSIKEDSNCWNYLGMIEVEAHGGSMAAGLEHFKKALEIMPANGHAQFNLGSIYFDDEKWELALACFNAVDPKNSTFARASNFIGRIYSSSIFKGYDLGKASAAFDKAHQLFPKDAAYAYNLGWVAYAEKEWTLAQEWFEKAVANDPDYFDAINYLGLIAENLGKPDQAIQIFNDGLSRDPNHKNMRYNLGRIYYAADMLPEAKQCMEITVQMEPNSAEGMNYLGLIEKAEGNREKAIQWFTQALTVVPSYYYPCYNLGVLYYDAADYEKAATYFKQTISLDVANVYAYNYLGLIAETISTSEDAISFYAKAIELKEDFELAYYNLGIVQYKQAKYEDAIAAFKKSLKLEYQPGVCCNYLGAISFTQNNIDDAIYYYQQALEHIPDYEFALFNLGECYFEKAEFSTSLEYWSRVEAQRPSDWEVLWYQARCAMRLRNDADVNRYMSALEKLEDVPEEKLALLKKEKEELASA
ncbi:MAG TPA: tetratricopeptide repeat protein [Phnomibacter sp.]|nr:tetratricopeptide repeat protein [Phnomibacter sp.]